ncbi:MAG TPA: sugar transferase [Bacillota bacterium]|nr:sugar transferase [Bacillota bacterium]
MLNNQVKTKYRISIHPFMKRLLDILFSLLLLVVCFPIGIIIYWRVKKHVGKPVFIKQLHVGENGKPFTRIQFRTRVHASSVIHAFPPQPLSRTWLRGVPDSVVFTKEMTGLLSQVGIFLKKYHLHHLPELLHVIKGDMSLVGPHPEIIEVAAHYNETQRKRLTTKPGIMGLSQLKGYTYQQHSKMIKEDLIYVEKKSIWLDLKIMGCVLIRYPNRYQNKRQILTWYGRSIGE